MAKNKYPRIGNKFPMENNFSKTAPKSGSVRCAMCHYGAGIMRIDIQVDWFRGNDDVFYLCQKCAWLPDHKILSELYDSKEATDGS